MRENFNLNKRRREEAKKKKREEKRLKRLNNNASETLPENPFADPQPPQNISGNQNP